MFVSLFVVVKIIKLKKLTINSSKINDKGMVKLFWDQKNKNKNKNLIKSYKVVIIFQH